MLRLPMFAGVPRHSVVRERIQKERRKKVALAAARTRRRLKMTPRAMTERRTLKDPIILLLGPYLQRGCGKKEGAFLDHLGKAIVS